MSVVTGHARTIQETRAISDQGLDTIIDRAFDETSWNGIVRRGREGLGGHSPGLSLARAPPPSLAPGQRQNSAQQSAETKTET